MAAPVDSDDEWDEAAWCADDQRLLSEFTDVAQEEKRFMHLWNLHAKRFPTVADSLLHSTCEVN